MLPKIWYTIEKLSDKKIYGRTVHALDYVRLQCGNQLTYKIKISKFINHNLNKAQQILILSKIGLLSDNCDICVNF